MKKKILLVLVATAMLASFAACGGGSAKPADTSPAVSGEKVLRLLSGEPSTLDPQICNDTLSAFYVEEIYSGLLTLVPVPKDVAAQYINERELPALVDGIVEKMPTLWQEWTKKKFLGPNNDVVVVLAPDLAKEIPEPVQNPDGTVSYIFHLRENATFHNGKKVTAHDFKFSFERAADPTGPDRASPFTLPTCDLYLSDIVGVKDRMYGKVKEVKGVEVIDDLTLKITIDAPKAYFLWKLTYPTAFVIDKDKIVHPRTGEPLDIDWTAQPNGTGPFVLKERTTKRIILEKNKNFYLDPALIDRVEINMEGGDAITLYQQGKIDLVGIGPEEIERLNEFQGEYFATPEFGIYYIAFNCEKPPLDDVNVRKALAYAIDMQTICRVTLKNLLAPPQGILPPGIPGYRPDFKGAAYDPQKAKAYLESSRYWDANLKTLAVNGQPVKLTLSRSGRGPSPGDVTAAILDMWKKNLGIEVTTRTPLDFSTFQKELQLGKFDMFIHGWVADYPDPEDFLDLKFYSERRVENRETRYKNLEVDRLLREARLEQDHEKRIKLYQQAEDLIMQDLPWIPLFYNKNTLVVNQQVKGYYPFPLVIPFLRYIDIVQK